MYSEKTRSVQNQMIIHPQQEEEKLSDGEEKLSDGEEMFQSFQEDKKKDKKHLKNCF